MYITGGVENFYDDFPSDYIPIIIKITYCAWNDIESNVNIDSLENNINMMLIEESKRLKNSYGLPFKIRPEIIDGSGKIDIIWDFTGTNQEEIYFAFECKRLRFLSPNGLLRANYSEYTGVDGMMCFISGKYSNAVSSGGMIGYVLDGNLKRAINGISNSIRSKAKKLKLNSISLEKSSIFPDNYKIRESLHSTDCHLFKIHHVFLAKS